MLSATIKYLVDSREIQWSTSVIVYDLNDLNIFMITCFFSFFFFAVVVVGEP